MTPYLVRSGALHLAAFALFFAVASANHRSKKVFYSIDFLGAAAGSAGSGAGRAAPPAPEKGDKEVLKQPEALPSLKRWLPKARAATLHQAELAVPSKKKGAPEAVEEPAMMGPSRNASTSLSTGGAATAAGAGTGTQVNADLSNFPYPWYLSRLRSALWTQWSRRMPGGSAVCAVSFTIARDGAVSDVAVSERSSSSDFDYIAMSAVSAAAPFPPLPEDFADATLKVHVRFQSLP